MKYIQPVYEARECETLGTYFRDLWVNGIIFAREVPTEVAEWAITNPQIFNGSVGVDITKLRTWILENEYVRSTSKPLP